MRLPATVVTGTGVAVETTEPTGGGRSLLRNEVGDMLFAAMLVFLLVVVVAAVLGGVAALPAVLVLVIFAAAAYMISRHGDVRRPPDTRA